ncbi:tRNA lysidine(34) synthetase TilS [Desulfobacterota bacterium M19]
MHPLEKKVLNNCLAHHLLKLGDGLLIGVSGGPDSMALLYIMAALAPRLGITLTAAYANHGLRPAETPAEEHLTREHAAKLAINYHTVRLPVREVAAKQKISIEHAARDLRYAFFKEVMTEIKAVRLAVAHQADDQAEEVIIRLLRGSGRQGLAGMRMRRDEIIRPLLTVSRQEIITYLQDRHIKSLTDSSNSSRKYLRNRVRLDLMPRLIQEFNPALKKVLCRTAAILQAEDELLDEMTDKAWRRTIQEKDHRLLINLEAFAGEPLAIKRRLLEKAFWRLKRRPGQRQIESVIHLTVAHPHVIHLGRGLRAWREGGRVIMACPRGETSSRQNLVDLDGPGFEYTVAGPGTYPLPVLNRQLVVEVTTPPSSAALRRKGISFLDYALINFPLIIRNYRPGDRFSPANGSGSKKVGDFMTDRKIPRSQRRQIPLVLNNGKVAALLNLAIDNDYIITPGTRKSLKLSLE